MYEGMGLAFGIDGMGWGGFRFWVRNEIPPITYMRVDRNCVLYLLRRT